VDVTTILAAAIAGMSGVAAGYLGMRQQTQTMRAQLNDERNRDATKRKEMLQDRRAQTYGGLLNVERGLRLLLASGKSLSYADYAKWWHDYGELTSLVVITGTSVVSDQAETLERLYGQLEADRMSVASDSLGKAITRAFQRHEPEIERARAHLIELMRADVAPDDHDGRLGAGRLEISKTDGSSSTKTHIDTPEIAVDSTAKYISLDRLRQVVAAVQEQVNRDFGPAWGIGASLAVCDDLSQITPGAWRLTVADEIGAPGTASFHSNLGPTPYTMVVATEGWELSFSHECLEMLANPFFEVFREGPSPKRGLGRVKFSVQVCDPCPWLEHGYQIHGVTVSDFVLPNFYDPSRAIGNRYDQSGVIAQPFEIAQGGYLTWYDRRHLWQLQRFGEHPKFADLGKYEGIEAAIGALRDPRIAFYSPPQQ